MTVLSIPNNAFLQYPNQYLYVSIPSLQQYTITFSIIYVCLSMEYDSIFNKRAPSGLCMQSLSGTFHKHQSNYSVDCHILLCSKTCLQGTPLIMDGFSEWSPIFSMDTCSGIFGHPLKTGFTYQYN